MGAAADDWWKDESKLDDFLVKCCTSNLPVASQTSLTPEPLPKPPSQREEESFLSLPKKLHDTFYFFCDSVLKRME